VTTNDTATITPTAEFRAGYEAALAEAIRLIDSLRGPGDSATASARTLLQVRARLLDLRERKLVA
jgi:hypothetical protein